MTARLSITPRIVFLVLLFGAIIGLQFSYDRAQPVLDASLPGSFPASIVRMADMGFHSTVASFLWAPTMPEILDLFRGRNEYLGDVAYVNAVDPKLSYPYAFSVLTLPAVPAQAFPYRVKAATEIGLRGLADADPDWRIPYYMAINYYLELKDLKNAAKYFDVAANTLGVPDYAARFALNFGIDQKERDRVRNLWITVYESTNDLDAKARAAAYVERLNDFDYLEAAAKAYRQKFGSWPATPGDLVTKKMVPAVPEDPFGFTFIINTDGTAGIDLTKLPAYLMAPPQQ
jgi:hypothetical protein